jgi:excisionase family DNA binding protein
MNDITGELIQALTKASTRRKTLALEVLRGQHDLKEPSRPLLYSMSQAARVLGVSRTTLWRLVQGGRLPKVQLRDNTYRIRSADLYRLVENGTLETRRVAS